MEQNRTPLLDAVTEYIETKPAYFRIPGHRLERGISSRWTERVGTKIFQYDVTETPMTDDLHCPEEAIAEAQSLAAELYHAKRSFFLVNGTTCGNEAMIMSVVRPGEKIMVARNAHKSAMMGLIISGAVPVYVMPEVCSEWGIQGGITARSVERTFMEHPDCKAVFLVSPSYYGVCSELDKIAKVCHAHNALLLVDEAHGGHLYFGRDIDGMPQGALLQGADMCVQSMHKVTGALTQSSILHIGTNRVDETRVAKNLHIVQSTSPSYLLMTSLDCARYEFAMHGQEMVRKAWEQAADLRRRICQIPGMKCMGREVVSTCGIAGLDETRLVISAGELGITGYELDKLLFENYHVDMELSDAENVLAILTYANIKEDGERLLHALEEIAQKSRDNKDNIMTKEKSKKLPEIPRQCMTPRDAYYATGHKIDWQQAIGHISGEMLAPYPPGIPVLYPGELITKEVWQYMEDYRKGGYHMHGPADQKLQTIEVLESC